MNKFDMTDLMPAETTFELDGKTYTLKKFSLAAQIWMRQRFGEEKIKKIFEKGSLPEICETVHFLLKDKSDFPTFEHLAESICTHKDRITVFRALMETIGISQPVMEKIVRDSADEKKSQQPIGPNSTTPSPAPTDTQ